MSLVYRQLIVTLSANLEILGCSNIGYVINLRGSTSKEPPHLVQYPPASRTPRMHTHIVQTYSTREQSKSQHAHMHT